MRDYLVLSEVQAIVPPEDFNIKLSHVGNLYVLDEDKDGRFTCKELVHFATYCLKNVPNFKAYEFHFQIQAQSTILLWHELNSTNGEDDFTAWIGRLIYENKGVDYFDIVPDIPFVKIESVKLLYDILDMNLLNGFTYQNFFYQLQQAAEELDMMALDCRELDDFVPLTVCQEFARDFQIGFRSLFTEIELEKIK